MKADRIRFDELPEPELTLDELLLLADWPQPSQLLARRIQNEWSSICREHREQRVSRWSLGMAAAAVMLSVTLGSMALRRRDTGSPQLLTSAKSKPTPALSDSPIDSLSDQRVLAGRNSYEQAMLFTLARRAESLDAQAPVTVRVARATQAAPQAMSPASFARTTDAALVSLSIGQQKDSESRVQFLVSLASRHDVKATTELVRFVLDPELHDEALQALSQSTDRPIGLLFTLLSDTHMHIRLGAAQALGGLNDPVITQRLIAMSMAEQTRREAIAALLSSSEPGAALFVDHLERDVNLRATTRATRRQLASTAQRLRRGLIPWSEEFF